MAIDTYLPTPDQLRNIIQQRTSGLPEYTEPTPNLPQGITDYAQHNRAFHNFNNDPLQSKRNEIERATVRKQQQMGLLIEKLKKKIPVLLLQVLHQNNFKLIKTDVTIFRVWMRVLV